MRKFIVLMVGFVLLLTACSPAGQPEPTSWPESVGWETALEILRSGHVEGVAQLHDLTVTFTMDDGSQIKTVEPVIDEIFREVERCGQPCEGIWLATE